MSGYRRDITTNYTTFDQATEGIIKVGSSTADPDLRKFCTYSNQWGLNACAGNATADAAEICDAIAGKPREELSRLFVYAMARTLHQELHKDEGTYIASCLEVLSRFGVCKETTWPYIESKVFVSPSLKSMREATGHKIHSYYKIVGKGDERVKQCIAALRSGCPVVFGTLVAEDLGKHRGDGVVGIPTGELAGGHAMILVGHDSKKKAFIVKNSWGSSFGVDGFAYFSEEYIAWGETWDLWAVYGGYST